MIHIKNNNKSKLEMTEMREKNSNLISIEEN